MATHSSTLAWKIPWMEEPGRLQSMGSLRVRHDWATSLWLFIFMHWRRKWQPTPVFLPGEYPGMGDPGGLLSMGWHRVRHDWSDLAAVKMMEHLQWTYTLVVSHLFIKKLIDEAFWSMYWVINWGNIKIRKTSYLYTHRIIIQSWNWKGPD